MDRQCIEAAADRLRRAEDERTPCEPVRDLLPDASIDDAYAVQELNTDRALQAGHRLAGWKIGLTSEVVQRQLGVDQPDSGALFEARSVRHGGTIDRTALLQPKVEAEIAFVLAEDLPHRVLTGTDIERATAYVLPAIEVVDSRIEAWDISIIDTVADNASSGLYVLGETRMPLAGLDLRQIQMSLSADGHEVSTGTGAACLGNPVDAVLWLATTAAGAGRPLKAGQVILSGALGPMVAAHAGTKFEASLTGMGSVEVSFA